MAAATVQDMNAALGPIQTELNRLGAQVGQMQVNFNDGGQALVDDANLKKAELKTLNDIHKADMQSYMESARGAFTEMRAELAAHRTALEQTYPELVNINVRIEEVKTGIQEKFGRQDAATAAQIDAKFKEVQASIQEIVAHV